MRNLRRTRWFLLVPAGLLLALVCMLSGGGQLLLQIVPTLLASNKQTHTGGGNCTTEHRGPSFGGTIVVDSNDIICSDLVSFGGTVAINGEVKGNVVEFGGNVIVDGTVDGDINLYSGMVTLQSGSHVHGDIHLYGGQWAHGENVQLDGSVIEHTQHPDWLFGARGGFSFPLLSLLTWAALGLLLTGLLPEHLMFVRTTIATKSRRSLLIGLLSAVLAPALLIVLIALILPIPLAIIVALGLVAAWALGMVAIGWLIGEFILLRVAPHQSSRPLQVVVGLVVLTLAGSLPFIGWLISIGAGLLGLGAVFLSRFGTRLYAQPRHPFIL